MCTRADTDRGLRFEGVLLGIRGALTLEPMSYFSSFPDHAPLSSYRSDKSIRVVTYGRALRAIKELVAKSGRYPDEFALHSLRIGEVTTLAAGRDISEIVFRREGRLKSNEFKAYTRKNRGFEKGVP